MAALVRIRTFGCKTKHPNASNSDANVRIRFAIRIRFGYEQRTMVSHPNSDLSGDGPEKGVGCVFISFFISKIVYPGYKFSINILFYNWPCQKYLQN